MSELLYQVRIDVTEDIAQEVRNKNYYKLNDYIDAILLKVDAELICQFDAFNNFLNELSGDESKLENELKFIERRSRLRLANEIVDERINKLIAFDKNNLNF